MEKDNALRPDELHRTCDPASLGFESTEELEPLSGALGQADAMGALEFGVSVTSPGYNVFVLGDPGSGRKTFVRHALRTRAATEPTPPDWCYVYNFKEPRHPRVLRLPPGAASAFAEDMSELLDDLRHAIPQALEADDVVERRTALVEQREKEASEAIEGLRQDLEADELVALVGRGEGLIVVPARGGEPLTQDVYGDLPEEMREKIDEQVREARAKAMTIQRRVHELQREARELVELLHREVTRSVVYHRISRLEEKYEEIEVVREHLAAVADDVVRHSDRFTSRPESEEEMAKLMLEAGQEDPFRRYEVNVLVSREPETGAPVVEESNPNISSLLGRMERQLQFGMMVTDFTRIAPGALLRANGGYLILEAAEVLGRPLAWSALKRALETAEIRPAEPQAEMGLTVTETLEPEPIPADVKVVLVGEPHLFYLLHAHDSDFRELFKVKADFRPRIERTPEIERRYGEFIASHCSTHGLPHFDAPAVAWIIEEGSRLAENREKLTTRFGEVVDLINESVHWATASGKTRVGTPEVDRALEERDRRNRRPHREVLDLIERGVLAFDPTGERAGQLYGIGLLSLADETFGRPIRVMASAYLGTSGVINIEREAALSGPIHNKGFLVLSGYLGRRFARTHPLILAASLSFDQLYEEVEGDSASAAEFFALLSAIGGVPIRQGVAVTGAINQEGVILPVGGVTQKVEGYFAACRRMGLTGEQGVILPRRNVENLVVRREVREAVAAGDFHVWAISQVEEGWPILTGLGAGDDADGTFPEGTVYRAVADQLARWAEEWTDFGSESGAEKSPRAQVVPGEEDADEGELPEGVDGPELPSPE